MANVLILRAEPVASLTEQALAARGHRALKCPLFEIHDTDAALPDKKIDGLILTSRTAVAVLKQRGWRSPNPKIPIFCVGAKTAQAAADLGSGNILTGRGTASALADMIVNAKLPGDARLLYAAACERAFDFDAALSARGITLETVAIYEMRKRPPHDGVLEAALKQINGGAVFIYSARSAAYFAELLLEETLRPYISATTLIAISGKAVERLQVLPWRNILVAATPDETAMIDLIPASAGHQPA